MPRPGRCAVRLRSASRRCARSCARSCDAARVGGLRGGGRDAQIRGWVAWGGCVGQLRGWAARGSCVGGSRGVGAWGSCVGWLRGAQVRPATAARDRVSRSCGGRLRGAVRTQLTLAAQLSFGVDLPRQPQGDGCTPTSAVLFFHSVSCFSFRLLGQAHRGALLRHRALHLPL